MTEASQILLQHHLKKLRLPTFQGEYAKQAQLCAAENKDHIQYLARLCQMEVIEPDRVYRKQLSSYSAARVTVFMLS